MLKLSSTVLIIRMIYRLFILTLLIYLPFVIADVNDIEPSIEIRSDKSKVLYYLLEPPNLNDSDSLLLVLQGSDCNSALRIESIRSKFWTVWPAADLLLVEKIGINNTLPYSTDADRKDCPELYLQKDNPKQRVEDIQLVLNKIRKQTNYSTIIVIGGSEGALVADLLTSSVNYIDATISFNGGGRWFIDDVLHNMNSHFTSEDERNREIKEFKQFASRIVNNPPFDIVASGHGYYWWHESLSTDHYAVLMDVETPLLIIQGGKDKSVSPEKVEDMLKALKSAGKDNIEYLVYEDLDHFFYGTDGKRRLNVVIEDMKTWLNTKLKTGHDSVSIPVAPE